MATKKNNNSRDDRIKALEAQIKLITEELEILKQEEEEPAEIFNFSMLDKALKQTTLVIDSGGNIVKNAVNPYEMHDVFCAYPNNETAVYAQRLKCFNDRLLAFKYCYDRDYVPNFFDDTKKYFVWYDNDERIYKV